MPRLAVRHLGSYPQRSGAEKSRAAALQVCFRHEDPNRLSETSHSRFNHERTLDLPTAEQGSAMARETAADRWPGSFFFRGLSGAAQPELSVDVRRHPRVHARRADRHRHRAGDALHAACRSRLQICRGHHARRQLRLAAALPARQRRVDVLPRRLHPHVPRHLLRLIQGAARGALDPRRASSTC